MDNPISSRDSQCQWPCSLWSSRGIALEIRRKKPRSTPIVGKKIFPLNAPLCSGEQSLKNSLLMRSLQALESNQVNVIAATLRARIPTDHLPLRNMIIRWWSSTHNNEAHKLILQSTPIFIC
ncbi:hypothetical protein H5410_003242 [Solanum commersonii]|uniref:Uncharacterized protein n=1 Tax=Solanum commersonii TaxID=4109 RepID=A0A9J6B452_SOLCO|nr:hypothetical protein H5410_003242 [Solanum commersonii]